MRKITKEISESFKLGLNKSKGNTRTSGNRVYLHGNAIAEKREDGLYVTLSGWPTVTTRERVNGILEAFGCSKRFHQSNFSQYFGEQVIENTNHWVKAV